MKSVFIFDINKCVACEACVVACALENGITQTELLYRNIHTFNTLQHPAKPVFFHSLACNHCNDAPCLKNCPALAYSIDNETGAVIHNPEKCIGCKYCTWTCPYDAPHYNNNKQIVEKCTACNSRLKQGELPKCVSLCPTGALTFEARTAIPEDVSIAGFPKKATFPSIEFVPLRQNNAIPTIDYSENPVSDLKILHQITPPPPQKIIAKNEMPLIIFTLMAALVAGAYFSTVFSDFYLSAALFAAGGFLSLLISMLHLGRKERAWRSVLNIKNSWLSREIFFYNAFVFLATADLYNIITIQGLDILTVIIGFFALISIDRVYFMAETGSKINFYSSSVFLTALFTAAVLINNLYAIVLLIIVKVALTIYHNFEKIKKLEKNGLQIISIRIDLIFSLPIICALIDFEFLRPLILLSFLTGEIIDRYLFYKNLKIASPKNRMFDDYMNYEL